MTPLPEAVDVIPVPPNKDKVSESKSIAIVDDPSEISKSNILLNSSPILRKKSYNFFLFIYLSI